MRPEHRIARAFTLVELLIAMAILSVIVLLLTSLLSGVSRAWIAGEQQVSEFQDGRAILELISRELAQAVISPNLQFVQNPTLAGGLNQRPNSDSIFWQAPATSTSNGNLAEIGYYLTDNYELRRLYIPPTDTANYQIFTSPNQPMDDSAPWLTNYITADLTTPLSSGVLAFWVRCFDRNGDLIPWLPSDGAFKFNSAAHFQPAIPGQSSSFKYTNAATTARGNLLPTIVELTIVTLDRRTFLRNPTIPAQTTQNTPDDLPSVTASFNQQLISNKIQNAHTFSTRVQLVNAGQ